MQIHKIQNNYQKLNFKGKTIPKFVGHFDPAQQVPLTDEIRESLIRNANRSRIARTIDMIRGPKKPEVQSDLSFLDPNNIINNKTGHISHILPDGSLYEVEDAYDRTALLKTAPDSDSILKKIITGATENHVEAAVADTADTLNDSVSIATDIASDAAEEIAGKVAEHADTLGEIIDIVS